MMRQFHTKQFADVKHEEEEHLVLNIRFLQLDLEKEQHNMGLYFGFLQLGSEKKEKMGSDEEEECLGHNTGFEL